MVSIKATVLSELSKFSKVLSAPPNANLNLRTQKVGQSMAFIYINYFKRVHQVVHCVILFSKPLALLTLFHQQ